MSDRPPRLRVITASATPEEVAAIVAAVTALEAQRRAVANAALAAQPDAGPQSLWVRASRMTARRGGMTRGPWRMSGRVVRRARA